MDTRELRIGSSVLCNGVRAKVIGLQTWDFKGKPIYQVKVKSPETSEELEVGGFAEVMQPIPITEELLKELGFDKSETKQYDWYKHIDDFSIFIRIVKRGRYRAEVYSEFSHHGNMVCYYLHELETFVYLTTKKELI